MRKVTLTFDYKPHYFPNYHWSAKLIIINPLGLEAKLNSVDTDAEASCIILRKGVHWFTHFTLHRKWELQNYAVSSQAVVLSNAETVFKSI